MEVVSFDEPTTGGLLAQDGLELVTFLSLLGIQV